MIRTNRRLWLGAGILSVAGLLPAIAGAGQQPVVAAPGQPLNITVTTAAAAPDTSFVLGPRSGKVTPCRNGCTHTGGGNIDVQNPAPDTIVVTMTGAAVAYGTPTGGSTAALMADLAQQFEVSFDKPSVKAAKLTMDGRVVGFLRSHKHGTAEECANASVSGAGAGSLALAMPSHAVGGGENLSVNDKEGPVSVVIPAAGKFVLNASFRVSAAMPKGLLPGKAPSAEFAPDPAIDPLWISYKEPFHGAKKADLGFQITIKVAPEEVPAPAPAPMPAPTK